MVISICSRCKRERLIYAKELCASCYNYKFKDNPNIKLSREKWAKSHRDYWREYRKHK